MPYPRVYDDGQTIEIDLHGATVGEAAEMVQRLIPLAASRGRSTVRIVHGASSSERSHDRDTIRTILHRMLTEGSFGRDVQDWFAFETTISISVAVSGHRDHRRITILDLT